MNASFQKFNFSIGSEIGNDHYQKQFSRQFALEHALLLLLPSTIEEVLFFFLIPHHGTSLDTLYLDPIHVRRTVSIAISELRHKQKMREYPVASLVVIRFPGMNGKNTEIGKKILKCNNDEENY